ncbi:hypothetical protein AB4865_00975 [Capnocytophaga sp. ARDL2]|uniref:hypothetical protein n=1 Tax=Capnocytophaga sp. ARDL2 TaxID=3238809 RepID=UPI0035582A5C
MKTKREKLEQKYKVFSSKGGYLNEQQELIKSFISKNQPIKISDLAKFFPDISLSTLKKDLQYMRSEKNLTMIGQGKGSVYIINED